MYKLVALDLDGTLFNSKSEISSVNKNAIKNLIKNNIKVVIASGRPYPVVRKVLEKLDLVIAGSYSVTMNGAMVVDNVTGKSCCTFTIPGYNVAKLGYFAKQNNCFIHGFSIKRGLLVNKKNPYTDIECFRGLIPYTVQDFTQISDDESFYKVLLCNDQDNLNLAINQIPKVFHQDFKIIRSLDVALEFLNPNAGKGQALVSLGNMLGINSSEMIAFGDEQNDLDMLEAVGLGIAMGNASSFIKEKAGFVTLSNDDDGVAYGINKFILDTI